MEELVVIYLSGLLFLSGGEINAETTHAAPDGKDPGENQLPRHSCLD
jgi:hypothetical protein